MNSPVNFNDPTGHIPSCDPDDALCQQKQSAQTKNQNSGYLKRELTKKYRIKFEGDWKDFELRMVSEALRKMAAYIGGEKNLNTAFTSAAQSLDANATVITMERVARARINPNSTAPAAAGWCNGSTGHGCIKTAIQVADDTFSHTYQYGGSDYPRPTSFNLDERIQFTFAHEFTHVLADASPIAVNVYKSVWQGKEENMANEFAQSAISQGSLETQFSGWAVDYGFWNYP